MQPYRDQTKTVLDRAILEAEVVRIIHATEAAGATLRALGSLAVSMHGHASSALLSEFSRTYADIDLVGYRRDARTVGRVLGTLGYAEDREISITSEGYRSIYHAAASGVHVDIFFDRLAFSHNIPVADRLAADSPTLPLAELLLTKLQIRQINEKDVIDVALLLLEHPPGEGDAETVNASRIARICADDWGLWRTVSLNLDKTETLVGGFQPLSEGQRATIQERGRDLKAAIDAEPKTLGWRMRARVGDRRQWWSDVDEVL